MSEYYLYGGAVVSGSGAVVSCQSINEKRTERFLPRDDLICTLVLRYPCEVGGEVGPVP